MENKKKTWILVVLLVVVLMFGGCVDRNIGSSKTVNMLHRVDKYDVTFLLPSNWKRVADQKQFDFQSTDGKSYMSVFVYKKIDLSQNQKPKDVYELQKENLFSKRQNVEQQQEVHEKKLEDKTVLSELYTAEKDGNKNYYYCSFIDFKEESGLFAWVLFTARPSDGENDLTEWDKILESARWEKSK